MKGFVKYLIFGIIFIVVGIVVLIIGLSVGGWSNTPEFTEQTYLQKSDDISNLNINFSVGEIETVFYDGDVIEIDYHTSNIYNVDINENNGTLTYKIRTKPLRISWGVINHPKTVIKLPAEHIYNFDTTINAGSMKVSGGQFGDVSVEMNAGHVEFSGDIKCEKLNIKLNAGMIELENAECSSLAVKSNAGKVEIDKLTCPKIDINTSAGAVDLNVNGIKGEYYIQVDRSAGSCNVSDQTGTDYSKKITVDISAGTVNINFGN